MRRRHLNLIFLLLLVANHSAFALIRVGRGNDPVDDDNWPAGSLKVANLKTRIGWWEGPPFGGGRWEFSYRGDVAALQEAIEWFARINSPQRLLVVHEGPQTNAVLDNAKVDWSFVVWNPQNWNHLYNGPNVAIAAEYPDGRFRSPVDPPRLDVYVAPAGGEGIEWAKVKVPDGVTVRDERATANGYDAAAGSVLRGRVYDMQTSKPIIRAKIALAKTDLSALTKKEGKFEIKNVPEGTFAVSVSADEYVPRLVCHAEMGKNALREEIIYLAKATRLKGMVKDTADKALAGVKVRAATIIASDGRAYVLPEPAEMVTGDDGKFALRVPTGVVRLSAGDASHHMLDVLAMHPAPKDDIVLRMTETGAVEGRVVNADGSPVSEGDVSVNPAGKLEEHVGKWGGGTKIKADGTFQFDRVPPGKYLVSADPGRAILGDDPTTKEIEVKAGETTDVTVTKSGR